MAAQLLVVLALLELEDEDLVALELINDGSNNLGLASLSRIGNDLGAVDNSDSLQLNLVARSFSVTRMSPAATLYCLPPVLTIAYMYVSPWFCEAHTNLYVYFACRLYSARERWETVTAKSRQYSKLRYYTPRKSFDKRGFVDSSQVFLFSLAKAK